MSPHPTAATYAYGHGQGLSGRGTDQSGLSPFLPTKHYGCPPSDGVLKQELTSSSHSISSFFTATDWEYHQSATRYFRNLLNIRESTVYKRILAPCLTVTTFSALVALYNSTHTLPSEPPPPQPTLHELGSWKLASALPVQLRVSLCKAAEGTNTGISSRMGDARAMCASAVCTIATTPHTLLGSALSLLLVFRTNASYARLVEGRRVCARCTFHRVDRCSSIVPSDI